MKLSPAHSAQLVALVAERTRRARVTLTGTSMQPLLQAGMVVDIEPLRDPPRIGDILVFQSQTGLIAHRLVGGERFTRGVQNSVIADRLVDEHAGAFITSGDARPDRTEMVPRRLVVGRVSAIWSGAEPDAKRLDDERYRRLGSLFARTRALRSIASRMRAYGEVLVSLLFADSEQVAPPRAFAALMAATHDFERRRYALGVERLCSVPRSAILAMARRHHASGLVAGWLDEAAAAGVNVPADLREPVRRMRWTNALQAGRVLRCVGDVRDRLAAANIPHIFLKGGARLAAGAPGADLQFAGDVDVIVPVGSAKPAVDVLRDAGYRDVQTEQWRSSHGPWMHHREPLVLPGVDVPVEIHVTLAPESLVSQRLDYAALAPMLQRVRGPIGEANTLNAVGAAVHLGYHAREFSVWRDIVLLARYLRTFDPVDRHRFDALIRAESRDRLRLAAAVAAADALAFDRPGVPAEIGRYLKWVEVREDLPSRFGSPDFIEAIVGRCAIPKLRIHTLRDVQTVVRCYVRNLLLFVFIARTVWRRMAHIV